MSINLVLMRSTGVAGRVLLEGACSTQLARYLARGGVLGARFPKFKVGSPAGRALAFPRGPERAREPPSMQQLLAGLFSLTNTIDKLNKY